MITNDIEFKHLRHNLRHTRAPRVQVDGEVALNLGTVKLLVPKNGGSFVLYLQALGFNYGILNSSFSFNLHITHHGCTFSVAV
jgi:hypothetical protein